MTVIVYDRQKRQWLDKDSTSGFTFDKKKASEFLDRSQAVMFMVGHPQYSDLLVSDTIEFQKKK